MTVVAFTPKVTPPKDRRYKVELWKGTDKVTCWILPTSPDYWQCWMRLNGRETFARHTDDAPLLDRIAVMMGIVVAGLKADGWSEML